MPESLLNKSQVDVAGDEMRRQAVFQDVRVPFLRWHASSFGTRSEDTEELCSAEPTTLLTCEQVIRAVSMPFAKPSTQRLRFVKEWLPAVLIERLKLTE